MVIQKDEIKDVVKILKNVNFYPVGGEHSIVFPIDNSKKEDFDGIELTTKDKGTGINKKPIPCLILSESDTMPVVLGYCDISYSRPFDFIEYTELVDYKLSKNEKKVLTDKDCYVVNKENLLIAFELGKHKK